MRSLIKLTFSLQSLGSQFLGQLHKMTVFLSNLLIVRVQIFRLLGVLFGLFRGNTERNEDRTATAWVFNTCSFFLLCVYRDNDLQILC